MQKNCGDWGIQGGFKGGGWVTSVFHVAEIAGCNEMPGICLNGRSFGSVAAILPVGMKPRGAAGSGMLIGDVGRVCNRAQSPSQVQCGFDLQVAAVCLQSFVDYPESTGVLIEGVDTVTDARHDVRINQ